MTIVHIIGIILTVGILLAVSLLSGRKVKDAASFTTGGGSGSWMVCGAILGTLVGGQSTIGTAQLAFSFGLSAWWFTIGAALGALVLGVVYAAPLRRSGCTTLMEVVRQQYGRQAETVGSILFLVGIFISSYLLISEIPMFALKFKTWGWKGNEIKYIFLLTCIPMLFMGIFGLAAIIAWYVILSAVNTYMFN
jgi:Na+(H+)/acetate symporter ActP